MRFEGKENDDRNSQQTCELRHKRNEQSPFNDRNVSNTQDNSNNNLRQSEKAGNKGGLHGYEFLASADPL